MRYVIQCTILSVLLIWSLDFWGCPQFALEMSNWWNKKNKKTRVSANSLRDLDPVTGLMRHHLPNTYPEIWLRLIWKRLNSSRTSNVFLMVLKTWVLYKTIWNDIQPQFPDTCTNPWLNTEESHHLIYNECLQRLLLLPLIHKWTKKGRWNREEKSGGRRPSLLHQLMWTFGGKSPGVPRTTVRRHRLWTHANEGSSAL